ncbi:hypothetical protein AB6D66_11830 [Vibrio pomeroyi]|uniref:Lipoprotein n=1 Tax=Vibrio pomeroyi TaxID=198832 RepID=A0ABV4MWR4_9VIBR|nr:MULTISPECIES: hypothetical protein [unclassified Vibrio]
MKKSALFVALVAALLAGCNSSDSSNTTGGTAPHNPGEPILPPGDGDGSTGDQTDPDEDTDLNPAKDPLIIEAAQRWGTSYDEMYNACQLWDCNLLQVQERITFTIKRETQLLEGSAKVTFTLANNSNDLWPTYTFYSDLIEDADIDIEAVLSTFNHVKDNKIENEGSTLLGRKALINSWVTHHHAIV